MWPGRYQACKNEIMKTLNKFLSVGQLFELINRPEQSGAGSCMLIARRALHDAAQQIQSLTLSIPSVQTESDTSTKSKPTRGGHNILFESGRGEGSSESLSQYDLGKFL